MYDWSSLKTRLRKLFREFQLLLKGCTIEAKALQERRCKNRVSVVVERMYDWSRKMAVLTYFFECFSCCWKDVRLKRVSRWVFRFASRVSVVVERMYDWSRLSLSCRRFVKTFQLLLKGCTIEADPQKIPGFTSESFSCCWKDVRLKRHGQKTVAPFLIVSVVVERMYDWSTAERLERFQRL